MGQKAVFLSALAPRAWQAHETHDVSVYDINEIYIAQRSIFPPLTHERRVNLLTARALRGRVTGR
jgi:hypothetical protein